MDKQDVEAGMIERMSSAWTEESLMAQWDAHEQSGESGLRLALTHQLDPHGIHVEIWTERGPLVYFQPMFRVRLRYDDGDFHFDKFCSGEVSVTNAKSALIAAKMFQLLTREAYPAH